MSVGPPSIQADVLPRIWCVTVSFQDRDWPDRPPVVYREMAFGPEDAVWRVKSRFVGLSGESAKFHAEMARD